MQRDTAQTLGQLTPIVIPLVQQQAARQFWGGLLCRCQGFHRERRKQRIGLPLPQHAGSKRHHAAGFFVAAGGWLDFNIGHHAMLLTALRHIRQQRQTLPFKG
ncbi:hypothetical protein D3C77_678000 [compost metagenome]